MCEGCLEFGEEYFRVRDGATFGGFLRIRIGMGVDTYFGYLGVGPAPASGFEYGRPWLRWSTERTQQWWWSHKRTWSSGGGGECNHFEALLCVGEGFALHQGVHGVGRVH